MRRMILPVALATLAVGAGAADAQTTTTTTTTTTTPSASGSQYGTTPVVGTPTTTTTAPTNTGSGTPTTTGTTPTNTGSDTTTTTGGNGNSGGNGNNGGNNNGGNNGGGGGGSNGGGNGSPAGGSAAGLPNVLPTANDIVILDFGLASKSLKRDIEAALRLTGLNFRTAGNLSLARMRAFMKSPLLKLLSPKGVLASGAAFGAQLANPTPTARLVFTKLFGPRAALSQPIVRAVLTRRASLNHQQALFLLGVAKGLRSTGMPLAYVEQTTMRKTFIKSFRKQRVLTVRNVNKPLGKLRLAKIMLGELKTQKSVNALRASAPISGGNGSTGTMPWALLAIALAGVAFTTGGTVRRRLRGSAA